MKDEEDIEEEEIEDRSVKEAAESLEGFKNYQKEHRNSLTFGDY